MGLLLVDGSCSGQMPPLMTRTDTSGSWTQVCWVHVHCLNHWAMAATSLQPPPPSIWPHLFSGAGHEKRRGEQLKCIPGIYSVHWKFSMCTAARTSSYSPVGPNVFFCVFSLGLCFVCSFVIFLFVCVSFIFPWAVESSPLQFLMLA